MRLRIRRIALRFALILAVAAALPLAAYGVVSIWQLRNGTRASVENGNLNVATRAAEEIRRYITANAEILKSLGANLHGTEPRALAAGRHSQELRHRLSGIPRAHAVRRGRGDARDEPDRSPAGRGSEQRGAHYHRRRQHVSDPRRHRPSALCDLCHSPHATQSTRRLAGRRIQPRGNVEDGRSHTDRRARASRWSSVRHGALVAHGDPDKKALVAQVVNMTGHHPLVGHQQAPRGGGIR